MSRDGPNEFKTRQQRWQSLLNQLQLAFMNVVKLSIQRLQELDEVSGLRLLLNKLLVLILELVERHALIALLLRVLQDLLDSLDLRQVQLLVKSVEMSSTLPPILSLPGRRRLIWLLLILQLQRFLYR